MTGHGQQHAHDHPQHGHHRHGHDGHGNGADRDDDALAEVLDLDAAIAGDYRDEVLGWAQDHLRHPVATVLDLGAGTGTGTLALAHRFEAEVVALDRSATMLSRVRRAAEQAGVKGRVRTVEADLDGAWRDTLAGVHSPDLVWASSSLHELGAPDRLLGEVADLLAPDGLLVVVELAGFPRVLPDDLGFGRPGLEDRAHRAVSAMGWNSYPDWAPHLARAGLSPLGRRDIDVVLDPAPPEAGRYAQSFLARMRSAVGERLAADDLATLDELLDGSGPHSLRRREDLVVRTRRSAWLARRDR